MCLFLAITISALASNTLELSVKGMHCGGCEAKFRTKIEALKGITKVKEVSAINSYTSLEFNPEVISEEEIIKNLIASTGYAITKIEAKTTTNTAPKACCKSGQTTGSTSTSSCSQAKTPSSCTKTSNTTNENNKKTKNGK